jgi:hypothetical protein
MYNYLLCFSKSHVTAAVGTYDTETNAQNILISEDLCLFIIDEKDTNVSISILETIFNDTLIGCMVD